MQKGGVSPPKTPFQPPNGGSAGPLVGCPDWLGEGGILPSPRGSYQKERV